MEKHGPVKAAAPFVGLSRFKLAKILKQAGYKRPEDE